MLVKLFSRFFGAGLIVFFAQNVFAVGSLPEYFNFDGHLVMDASGNPASGTVSMKFQIRSPDGNCLLYEETQSAVQLTPDGAFSVKIGPGGGGSRNTVADSGIAWPVIMQNTSIVRSTTDATYCPAAYTPTLGDSRRLRVFVTDMVTPLSPDYSLAPTPYATVAETLQGKIPADFVQLRPGGKVGIGTSTPVVELEVNGQVRITGGAPAAGKVLTSDATGTASWEPLPTLPPATSSAAGFLSSADWTTFNSKQTALGFTPLNSANNLSDLLSLVTARANLGLGTAAVLNAAASGDATAGELVKGNDSRLNDVTIATSANTPTKIVKRDGSGNISVGLIKTDIGAPTAPAYSFTTDATSGIYSPGVGALGLSAGSEIIRITNSGNVGIGTTSPTAKLDVNGPINTISNMTVGGTLQVGSAGGPITNMKICTYAAGATTIADIIIACAGAAIGSVVSCSPDQNPSPATGWSAFISAAGNITIRFTGTGTFATANNWKCLVVN